MRGVLLVGALASLAGCAHTHIIANDPRAKIYADGEYLGRGDVEMDGRTGIPRTMTVMAKNGHAKVEKQVRREFTLGTFFAGLFSYGTGFFWAWQYPENIILTLPQDSGESSWDAAPSPWDEPPAGWDAAPNKTQPAAS